MDLIDFFRYFAALAMVMGLLGFAWLAAKRYGLPGIVKGASMKRLAITETLVMGPRHKLLLIKRDNIEHLVLMSPQGATVIEGGIADGFAKALSAVENDTHISAEAAHA